MAEKSTPKEAQLAGMCPHGNFLGHCDQCAIPAKKGKPGQPKEKGAAPEQTARDFNPSAEQIEVAQKALSDYLGFKPGESVLFVKDASSKADTAAILQKAVIEAGGTVETITLDKKTKAKDLNALVKKCPVIIGLYLEDNKLTDSIFDKIEKYNNRFLVLYDLDANVFSGEGALGENAQELAERLDKMEAVVHDAKGFKITSGYGTDLSVGMRSFGERQWFKENGILYPGKWGNLPAGELFTTPNEADVNGVLMLPAVDTAIAGEQGVDEFIRVEIRNGLISSIQGGKSAEKLRQKLEEEAKKEGRQKGNPLNVFRIAELSFGANSKARSTVSDSDQPYNAPGVSTVEAEKRLGTMHMAFGSSQHGEEGAEGFEDVGSHYDFVLPRGGLTVEMFKDRDDFKRGRNGRKIFDEGRINF